MEGARVAVRMVLSWPSRGASDAILTSSPEVGVSMPGLHLVHDRLGCQASPDLHAPCLTWRRRDLASACILLLVRTRSDLHVRAVNSAPASETERALYASEEEAQPFQL